MFCECFETFDQIIIIIISGDLVFERQNLATPLPILQLAGLTLAPAHRLYRVNDNDNQENNDNEDNNYDDARWHCQIG